MRILVGFGAACGTLVLLLASAGAQSSEPSLVIRAPESIEVSGDAEEQAEATRIEIAVENTPELGGFQFIITYDPDLLDYDRSERGDFLGSTGRELFCNEPIIDAGAARFACGSLGDEPAGPEGSGVLYSVYLRPKATGTTTLELTRTQLSSIEGNAIQSTVAGASIEVEEEASGLNWLIWGPVIGGVLALVVVIVVGLMMMGRRSRASAPATPATDYSDANSS